MPRRRRIVFLLLAGVGACAGSQRPGTPEGPPLGYDVPEPVRSVYAFSDTAEFSIDADRMGMMNVLSAQSGVAEVALRPTPDGVEATVRVESYSGRFENPNQGATTADEGDITGAWTARVDRRGVLEVIGEPSLTPRGRQVASGESLIRPMFAYLPDRPAGPGAEWVDTVMVTDTVGGRVSRAWSVVTSTLVGDTAVSGRRLLLIRTSSLTQVEVGGASGGVEILQRMSGTLRGTVLWDGERSLLVARWEDGALRGTLELPGMGLAGLPMEGTVRRAAWLRP